jgi:GNAT superfamily N-acetyltransferase
MKLSDSDKEVFEPKLWYITELCYTGVELPPREHFKRCVRHGDIFISGRVDEPFSSYALVNSSGDNCPLLRSIATLPTHRDERHATTLLLEIEEFYRAQGRSAIILHCKVDNPAQILYFKAGYRVTAVLRGYYKPEGDGLEMRKAL